MIFLLVCSIYHNSEKMHSLQTFLYLCWPFIGFLKSLSFSKAACSTENVWSKSGDVCPPGVRRSSRRWFSCPWSVIMNQSLIDLRLPPWEGRQRATATRSLPGRRRPLQEDSVLASLQPNSLQVQFPRSLQSWKPDLLTLLPANCPPPYPKFPSV